jgi:calcineurin-like phosphoesterase family protein
VKEVATVRMPDGQDIFLSHYAHRVWNRAHYGVIHLYGHSHSSLPDMNKSGDAGVDNWNFFPVSYDQIKDRFKNVEPTKHH